MHIDDLPDEARDCLTALIAEALKALESSKSPHHFAISDSTMESGTTRNDTLTGGLLRAPEKPPFKYDKSSLMGAHRALFESTSGTLYSVITHFSRESIESPWSAQTKLVSRAEHEQLVAHRLSIDNAIKAELERFATRPDWERVSFGRDSPKNLPSLVCRSALIGVERLEPTSRMFGLLAEAEAVYAQYGLKLRSANWTLRPQDLEFFEYYE